MTCYIPRWFTRRQAHPSTDPPVHGRESNSQPVDHKSDALTLTLPSHLVTYQSVDAVGWAKGCILYVCKNLALTPWCFSGHFVYCFTFSFIYRFTNGSGTVPMLLLILFVLFLFGRPLQKSPMLRSFKSDRDGV